MPHVEIECFSGKTEDQKKICAENILSEGKETL